MHMLITTNKAKTFSVPSSLVLIFTRIVFLLLSPLLILSLFCSCSSPFIGISGKAAAHAAAAWFSAPNSFTAGFILNEAFGLAEFSFDGSDVFRMTVISEDNSEGLKKIITADTVTTELLGLSFSSKAENDAFSILRSTFLFLQDADYPAGIQSTEAGKEYLTFIFSGVAFPGSGSGAAVSLKVQKQDGSPLTLTFNSAGLPASADSSSVISFSLNFSVRK